MSILVTTPTSLIADDFDTGDGHEGGNYGFFMSASFTAGLTIGTVTSTKYIKQGMGVIGANLPVGTNVFFIQDSHTFLTSHAATANSTSGSYFFYQNTASSWMPSSAHDGMMSDAGDTGDYQKNISHELVMAPYGGQDYYGFGFFNCNPTWGNPGGQFISVSDAVEYDIECPDDTNPLGGTEIPYWNPIHSASVVQSGSWVYAHTAAIMSANSTIYVQPDDDPSSPGAPRTQEGSICTHAGANVEIRWAKLLRHGTYTYYFGSGLNAPWTAIPGFSCTFSICYGTSSTVVATVDDTGTSNTGFYTTSTFTVTTPWAYMKLNMYGVAPYQNGVYGLPMLFTGSFGQYYAP